MSKSKVLVTAADGYTGTAIIKHILTTPAIKDNIGAICAQAEREYECKDLKDQGVHIVELDTLSPPDKMIDTLKRADIAVLIPSALPNKAKRAANLLEACKIAGLKKAVLISAAGCELASEEQHAIHEFQQIEHGAKQMGLELIILRANFYAENLLLYKDQMKQGKLPLPIGQGKLAPACLKDLAEVVGKLLVHEEKFKECPGKVITLTGAEALSGHELAERISQTLGTKIEFQNISNEEAKKILSGVKNLDESEKCFLLQFYDLVKAGKTDFCDPHAFQTLTGHAPTSLEEFVKIYKDELTGKS